MVMWISIYGYVGGGRQIWALWALEWARYER